MTRKLVILALILVLASCGEKKLEIVKISENQNKGIKEILDFYGGICDYKVHSSVSTNDGLKKYFEMEISKSKLVEKQSKVAEMTASNIAYLFYKNLKDEKNTYDAIHIILAFEDATTITFKYTTKLLEQVDKRIPVVFKIVELLAVYQKV